MPGPGGGSECVSGMEGEAAFVADRVIAVSERLKVELCETYQLPEAWAPWGTPWGLMGAS